MIPVHSISGFSRSVPAAIFGNNGEGPLVNGDVGFYSGRQMRTFYELNIGVGVTQVIRAIVPIDVILQELEVAVDDGWIRVGTYVGGTPGGAFGTPLPSIPCNNMSSRPLPFYVPQLQLATGGTHTGGTELDIIRLKTANTTVAASNVSGEQDSKRGIAANTYYFRLLNLGTGSATGVFRGVWEEQA